jgi:GAF domain-containing protein
MLATVVHLTQRQFGLYHAHVFTYREDTEELQIAACGWKEGDENEGTHGATTIPISQEQSLVARAGRSRQAVLVNDVRSDPGWLPNPMLPDTRAELAVPLLIGDRLLGVLDVQSDRLNAFTQEDANIQLTLVAGSYRGKTPILLPTRRNRQKGSHVEHHQPEDPKRHIGGSGLANRSP